MQTGAARRKIGILGGMGPEATLLLMQRVLRAVPARDDHDHIPLLVDQNPQIPSRIARLIEGQGEDPAPFLIAMAQALQQAGAVAIGMPCNTAHYYAPAIAAAISVPFIDMVSLAVAQARQEVGAGGRVGILGSPALRKIGVYDRALAAQDLQAIYPADDAALLDAIRSLKAQGVTPEAQQILRAALADVRAQGAGVTLIACTEFSLLRDAFADETALFDTLDCLVAEIIRLSTS